MGITDNLLTSTTIAAAAAAAVIDNLTIKNERRKNASMPFYYGCRFNHYHRCLYTYH